MPEPRPAPIPPEGSLGLLAVGYRGVVAWRARRQDEATPPAVRSDVALTIVSGLPRTGTSMMMQMLVAGGLPAYTDGLRPPDASNPRGYVEHEHVKRLARDQTWLPEADGHAVKVVAPLLPFLPPGPTYRVLLMERSLDDVLASQAAMLDRLGAPGASADLLRPVYERQLAEARAWAGRTPGVALLPIAFADAVASPHRVATHVAAFLGNDLDVAQMARAVAPDLVRQRGDA